MEKVRKLLSIKDGASTCSNQAYDAGSTPEYKDLKYKVLIHDSKKSLNTDLHSTEYPYIVVDANNDQKGSISKNYLESINTEENSCAADETYIRNGCQIKKVIKIDFFKVFYDII